MKKQVSQGSANQHDREVVRDDDRAIVVIEHRRTDGEGELVTNPKAIRAIEDDLETRRLPFVPGSHRLEPPDIEGDGSTARQQLASSGTRIAA